MSDYERRTFAGALEYLLGPVGSEKHTAYLTSASFRTSVDTMVHMMPAWIDGMLVACREADERMERDRAAIEATLRHPPLRLDDLERCPVCGWAKGFCHCEVRP